MPLEGYVLLACLALVTVLFVFRMRAETRREEEEEAEFAAALDEGRAIEYVDQKLETLVSAAPPWLWLLAGFGVMQARSIDVPWRSSLAAAVAYAALSMLAMRRVDVRASRGAAVLLILLAAGFGAFILLQSPGYRWARGPEWRSAFYVAALAVVPGFAAFGLTYQYHRLGGDRPARLSARRGR